MLHKNEKTKTNRLRQTLFSIQTCIVGWGETVTIDKRPEQDREHYLNQHEWSYWQTGIHSKKTETSSDYRAIAVQTAKFHRHRVFTSVGLSLEKTRGLRGHIWDHHTCEANIFMRTKINRMMQHWSTRVKSKSHRNLQHLNIYSMCLGTRGLTVHNHNNSALVIGTSLLNLSLMSHMQSQFQLEIFRGILVPKENLLAGTKVMASSWEIFH